MTGAVTAPVGRTDDAELAETRPSRGPLPYVVVGAALALRWVFVDVQSGDYRKLLSGWFQHLASHGFAGLADEFSNYKTPYLVLLWLATKLPASPIVAIKLVSVLFDLLLALFAYRIVREVRPASTWLPVILTGLVLFLPTVVLNSSAWAQCDAIYGSLCLGSGYLLLRRRPWFAGALFGLAFAFKLQAIFLLPVLVAVLVLNRMRVRALLAVPLAFFAALVPAWIAGRGLLSQLSVYPGQISGSSGGGNGPLGRPARSGGGTWSSDLQHVFTDNAPTWYAWLLADAGGWIRYAGLALTAAVIGGLGVWLLKRGRALMPGGVVVLAAAAMLTIPFLLPEMHERYFYGGEVLAVIAIAVDRRFIAVAAANQVASISTYWSYLSNAATLPLEVTALFAAAAVAGSLVILIRRLRCHQTPLTPLSVTRAPVGGSVRDLKGASET